NVKWNGARADYFRPQRVELGDWKALRAEQQMRCVVNILQQFCNLSGQEVSQDKTSVFSLKILLWMVTLAKSVLEAIPIYPMMTSIIPKACVDEIQKMQRRFIWGDTEHSRKYHVIGRKLQTGSQEFWCNVMWGKYRRGSTNNNVVAKTSDSHLWKSIVKLWPKLDELCFWTIRGGKSVDWYSQVWIEEGLRVVDL
ncbi:ribonuclease H, partial [Trifolium medium]|nr:ribonuclease H [Trifolium medium]